MRNTSSANRKQESLKLRSEFARSAFLRSCKYTKHTHVAHRSVCQCRWHLALSTIVGPWGKWSTCSPDSCDLPCHSGVQTYKKLNRFPQLWHKHVIISVRQCRCEKCQEIWGVNWDKDSVCECVVTLHSCPILEMVALPACSPSMAFSLKNRKILSSSGLSLSGIRYTPVNLGSRRKKKIN